MAITDVYFTSVDDLTLTNDAADTLTAVMEIDGTSTPSGTIDIRMSIGGASPIVIYTHTVTAWGEVNLSIPVNGIDAIYSGMANVTSAECKLQAYYNSVPGRYSSFTTTIDTSVVVPTVISATFKWSGGSGYPSQTSYAIEDQGVFYPAITGFSPSRGSVFDYATLSWNSGNVMVYYDDLYNIPEGRLADYDTITSPVDITIYDKRGLSVSTTSTFNVYQWNFTTPTFSLERGTYSGGVWSSLPTGEDVRLTVTADYPAATADYTVTGTVKVYAPSPWIVNTATFTGDGTSQTQYIYYTGVGVENAIDLNIQYSDNIVKQVGNLHLVITPLAMPIQITSDGEGLAIYDAPVSDEIHLGKPTNIVDLSLGNPLSIANGGHGGITAEEARENLGITYKNIGIVPVEQGGTGGKTVDAARNNLGINYATLGTVKIAEGGTGATDRGAAIANLNGLINAPSHFSVSYNSLDATGLVSASATIYAVANSMPSNSVITWTHSTNHTMYLTNAPENLGVVTVTKGIGVNYMSAMFYGQSGRAYFWKYSGSNSNFNNYWQRLSVASTITISDVTAAQTLTTTATRVNLDNSTAVNASDDSLSIISYGIRCNYPGYVEISAQLYAGSVTAGDRLNLNIYAGQSGSLSSIRVARYDSPATHVTGNIAPFLYNCAANDLIYLYAHNATAARGSIATGNQTYLTVKYV